MKKIIVAFKSGQRIEFGEVATGKDTLTLHGHFSELKVAKAKGLPYNGIHLHIDTQDIDYILYEEK